MADQDERDKGTTAAFLLGCLVGCLVTGGVVGSFAWVQLQHSRAVAQEEVIRAEQATVEAQRQAEQARQMAEQRDKMPPAKPDAKMPKAED